MKSVNTLHCSGISESSLKDIKGLSKLTNLKELKLGRLLCQDLTIEHVDALVSSIGMLQDLRYLSLIGTIECDGYCCQLDSLPNPPLRLIELDLRGCMCRRVPKWFGELSCLRVLRLRVLHLSSDEVRVLGELPSLVEALFLVLDVSQDKVLVGSGLFPVLENVWFSSDGDVSAYLSFEAGAMPKLQSLTLGFGWKEWRGATPVGMECLPCLQNITVDSRTCVVSVDPRVSAIYKEAAGLVGIDGPREDIVSLLMDSQQKLKVVSIVGFGGLGKTTLAKQVYDQIGGQFDCKAFLPVSQRPDVKSLLMALERKLGIGESSHAHELQEIVDHIREYLKHKRYISLLVLTHIIPWSSSQYLCGLIKLT
jgi:hypothetical protein